MHEASLSLRSYLSAQLMLNLVNMPTPFRRVFAGLFIYLLLSLLRKFLAVVNIENSSAVHDLQFGGSHNGVTHPNR